MIKIALLLLAVAGVIVAGTVAFYAYSVVQLQQTSQHDQAVQDCLAISTYTVSSSESGITTVEPIESVYRKCLELKGI